MNTDLQIFGEEHRKLVRWITEVLRTRHTINLLGEKLPVQVVTSDALQGKGGCAPKDYVVEIRADRIEHIDRESFALYVSSEDMDEAQRIVVRCEDLWLPPFVTTGSLYKIAEVIVAE